MINQQYREIEDHMMRCMRDSAHDKHHIYRVLYSALLLAKGHPEADRDVVITACLLHDIGRDAQSKDPSICHAREGARLAREFLTGRYPEAFVDRVCACIRTHRFRSDDPPTSIEAKLLFDADKLDAAGAVGIARTLIYQGQEMAGSIYNVSADGAVLSGDEKGDYEESFFMEYHRKLRHVYDRFYTEEAEAIARERQDIAEAYYRALLAECASTYRQGQEALRAIHGDSAADGEGNGSSE